MARKKEADGCLEKMQQPYKAVGVGKGTHGRAAGLKKYPWHCSYL
jgi:hypothetical protein